MLKGPAIRKGGRPRKHRSNAERQQAYRERVLAVTKPPRSFAETKDLQAQKLPLSHTPLSGQEMRPCCNMRLRNRQTAPATPPKSCFMHSEIHYQCEQTIHPLRSWKEGCFNNPFRDERSASATLLFQ